MARRATEWTTLRIRCCRCGRVDRFVVPAAAAFSLADRLMLAPCAGTLGRQAPCNSRDRRLDVRPAAAAERHGAAAIPG
ncbi:MULTISPECIES: hypothetical protein [Anaeromyxobacter]|uniref:hypothetical protein n=1 Tax=Anaeromyxobacter TaxID=161492 RepID=UPI001F55C939|nr:MULTISPECIES: hypothetical protein [unclassified Anaeromyxobacter]